MDSLIPLLAQHGPVGLAAIGMLVALGLHQRSDSKHHDDMESRLRLIEKDLVVKADVTRIYDRVEQLGHDMNDGQRAILILLAGAQQHQK